LDKPNKGKQRMMRATWLGCLCTIFTICSAEANFRDDIAGKRLVCSPVTFMFDWQGGVVMLFEQFDLGRNARWTSSSLTANFGTEGSWRIWRDRNNWWAQNQGAKAALECDRPR
jgi:hypothetical protein